MKLEKYWRMALTDSLYGYYSQNNVFSKEGDFTTSPEISPLFGEMIAIWLVYFLGKVGIYDEAKQTLNKKFRLVELGPGRGLLMRDIVKALK
jgi:NADH dehydrogenase [ubiquinone] 1 alpha subcomplex assembly factor 7